MGTPQAAGVKLNDGSSVHMAPYINKVFNRNLEHDSAERLRRVRGEGQCPGPRVAPPPADAIAPGTPFATLVTYNSPSKGKCTSAGVLSLLKSTLEGTTIAHPSAMGLKHTQGAKLSGELLLFSRPNAEVALQWSGRFGPTIDVDAASTTFVDLDITDEGRWEVDPNILNTFIDAAAQDIKYCPVIVAEPYDGVKACELRLANGVRCCLFCDAAVPLRIMLDHVAEHIAKGDAVADARHRGKAEPCGFCGRSTGTCKTMLNGTKVCTNCPYRYSFKYKKALEKRRNVPRKCPVPMCPASPFTWNIKYHLRLVHPSLDPETIEAIDWVAEKQIAWRARKTKAEKGEKVRRITIHMDKEAEEGMGQATTTGDEGGDKYGTQRPTSEADEDWRPERRASDESDGSDTDSLSTTNSSSGGASSTLSECSSDNSSWDSSAKVVVATGHKKVYKKTAKQPRGQGKQVKSGKAPVAASVAQKRQAPKRKPSRDSKRQRK